MSLNISTPAQTFSITKLSSTKKPTEILENISNNQKADIVFQRDEDLFLLSGDRVNLSEVQQFSSDLVKELKIFDRNHDDFLVEDELKYSVKEATQKVKTGAQQQIEEKSRLVNVAFHSESPLFLLPVATLALGIGVGTFLGENLAAEAAQTLKLAAKGGAIGAAVGLGLGIGGLALLAKNRVSLSEQILLNEQRIFNQVDQQVGQYKTSQWNQDSDLKILR